LQDNKKIEELFQRYLDNACTPEEVKTLLDFFGKEKNEDQLRQLIREHLLTGANENALPKNAEDQFVKTVFPEIKKALQLDRKQVLPLYRKNWFRVAAAACFVLAVTSSAFFLFRSPEQVPVVQNDIQNKEIKDIPPGRNNAVLTLDDGTNILLDQAANGTLAKQGNASVLKTDGQIAYEQEGAHKSSALIWNTIKTANASQYQLVLSDGTKVWLNAASSIRFPASFTGNERKVQITGEVYFEVAKDAKKRFKVEFSDQTGQKAEIEVFGTHFNVNTYSNEPEMRTTLLEGSVKISEANQTQMLKPGQQAILSKNRIQIKQKADLDQVMAWRNGYFLFNNTDIYTLMRQVARWYNIEISFEGQISNDGFSGKISRDVPLSQIIKVLEFNDMRVRREGNNKMIITQGASKQI
jgi:hypothetical protein